MQSGDAGTGSEMLVKLPQTLNRRRALRTLVALTAAAAGASAGLRPQEADAYQVTNAPSTDFAGPIRATGGNSTFPDGAANIGNNPNSGVGVYGAASGTGTVGYGVYGAASGTSSGYGVVGSGIGAHFSVGVRGSAEAGLGVAIVGSNQIGVIGNSSVSGGVGVNGSSTGDSGFGVWAYANGANGIGARGESASTGGNGVLGVNSSGGTGVLGQSSSGSGNTNVGVYGQAQGTSGGIGVLGLCSNDSSSVGVYAQSGTGTGFVGYSLSPAGAGAAAFNSTSGVGMYGISQGGGYGGVFQGSVYVTGALTVLGAKSAAVKGADGSLRRLYCMESPESWFEDFGSGQLSGGSATVQLAPDFAGVVHSDAYHVFLTPSGEPKGPLYVSKKSPSGFMVQEAGGGNSNIGFDYRIVAKRKDVTGARMEHVGEPPAFDVPAPLSPAAIPAPAVPNLPAGPRNGG